MCSRLFLGVIVVGLSSDVTWAGSKWFKTGGFPAIANSTVTVENANPGCLQAANAVLAANGVVSYSVTCLSSGATGCEGDVRIVVTPPEGLPTVKIVGFRCRSCGDLRSAEDLPTPADPDCWGGDICDPDAGGDTEATAIDVTDCAVAGDFAVPTTSEWGLVVMTLLLLTMGTIVYARRPQRRIICPPRLLVRSESPDERNGRVAPGG